MTFSERNLSALTFSRSTLLYAAFILSSAFWARFVILGIRDLISLDGLRISVWLTLALCAAGILAPYLLRAPPRVWLPKAALVAAGIGICTQLSVPEEKIHIILYGILGAIILVDLRRSGASSHPFFTAMLIASLIGALEESIQWCLPFRIGEIKDGVLNIAGAFLGVLFIQSGTRD